MDDNKSSLIEEVKKNFNSVVMTSDLRIARLIGLLETEEDFYYILADKDGFSYHSSVGNLIYINNTNDFYSIDKALALNDALKLQSPILQLI